MTRMLPIHVAFAVALAAVLTAPSVTLAQDAEPAAEPAVRQAVPRGSRPQGDNPRTGTAVPRSGPRAAPAPRPRPDDRAAPPPRPAPRPRDRAGAPNRGRTVVVRPPAVYDNYYYYPRRTYPYGYGAFGLGYLYYDPYRWQPGAYSGHGYGYDPRQVNSFNAGELRLDVSPREAQVYVDGYFAGAVDDYDGAFQALTLESGPYQIEIVAPGYDTLTFDVRINPGQKITYRGDLRRRP